MADTALKLRNPLEDLGSILDLFNGKTTTTTTSPETTTETTKSNMTPEMLQAQIDMAMAPLSQQSHGAGLSAYSDTNLALGRSQVAGDILAKNAGNTRTVSTSGGTRTSTTPGMLSSGQLPSTLSALALTQLGAPALKKLGSSSLLSDIGSSFSDIGSGADSMIGSIFSPESSVGRVNFSGATDAISSGMGALSGQDLSSAITSFVPDVVSSGAGDFLSGLADFFGFAEGGVVRAKGKKPGNSYADGGMVKSGDYDEGDDAYAEGGTVKKAPSTFVDRFIPTSNIRGGWEYGANLDANGEFYTRPAPVASAAPTNSGGGGGSSKESLPEGVSRVTTGDNSPIYLPTISQNAPSSERVYSGDSIRENTSPEGGYVTRDDLGSLSDDLRDAAIGDALTGFLQGGNYTPIGALITGVKGLAGYEKDIQGLLNTINSQDSGFDTPKSALGAAKGGYEPTTMQKTLSVAGGDKLFGGGYDAGGSESTTPTGASIPANPMSRDPAQVQQAAVADVLANVPSVGDTSQALVKAVTESANGGSTGISDSEAGANNDNYSNEGRASYRDGERGINIGGNSNMSFQEASASSGSFTTGVLSKSASYIQSLLSSPSPENSYTAPGRDSSGNFQGATVGLGGLAPGATQGYGQGADGGGDDGSGNMASGGEVRGPGTGTSDSIAAHLSDGEYVIDAKTVQALGPEFFQRIQAMFNPQAIASQKTKGRI